METEENQRGQLERSDLERGPHSRFGDTSEGIERLQFQLWGRMTSIEIAQAVGALSVAARELALAGLRNQFPRASDTELQLRLSVITLGRELATRAYPEILKLVDPPE